jgi:hypothetical protein
MTCSGPLLCLKIVVWITGWLVNGGDQNYVVGHKNQDPKKREIILFFIKK